jgi:MoxR-like ATPase
VTEQQSRLAAVGEVTSRSQLEAALFEVKRVIVGQEGMLERVLVALLSGGHLLLEGVPGLAKTRTIATLAQVLGGSFHRVQFTPDLVPSDLVGTRIWRPDTASFEVELGPVFCNFLLADEINRAPAKVQSALLEVMQEHQVTIGRQTFTVPQPFLVLATQNPIEQDGTYPLPEAQIDRFMMKVVVDYPNFSEEMSIVARSLVTAPVLREILDLEQLHALQAATQAVYVDRLVAEYAVALCDATRHPTTYQLGDLRPYLAYGASPRGSINLVAAARALAVLRGRGYALPQDVQELARDVLRHRLVLTYQALAEQVTADKLLAAVLDAIPAPRIDLAKDQPA